MADKACPVPRKELYAIVEQAAEDYLEAFKPPYSTLHDLNGTQRAELLALIRKQTGADIDQEQWSYLEDRPDLEVEDIVNALSLPE